MQSQKSESSQDKQICFDEAPEVVDIPPFKAYRNPGETTWELGILGEKCVNRKFESLEDIKETLKEKPWALIMIATAIYIQKLNKIKENGN